VLVTPLGSVRVVGDHAAAAAVELGMHLPAGLEFDFTREVFVLADIAGLVVVLAGIAEVRRLLGLRGISPGLSVEAGKPVE